jgi:hypothetical protein
MAVDLVMIRSAAIRSLRRPNAWAVALSIGLLLTGPAWATGSSAAAALPAVAHAPAIKAVYLLKFLPYIDWPAGAFTSDKEPWMIGVSGDDHVLAELQGLIAEREAKGRVASGRPVSARSVRGEADVLGLHVLYLGRSAQSALAQAALGRPILVVADDGEPVNAMLRFVEREGRLRFEARPSQADLAGLKIGARLLGVAERVLP